MNSDLTPVPADHPFKAGDVIEDSYANPAVVLAPPARGNLRVMQVCGSDRGRKSSIFLPQAARDGLLRTITGPRAEWAREVARAEWRKGNRW